jgi:hypothetical protein
VKKMVSASRHRVLEVIEAEGGHIRWFLWGKLCSIVCI